MRKTTLLIAAFLLISISSSMSVLEMKIVNEEIKEPFALDSGKNYVIVNSSQNLSAKEFLFKNPSVQMISYKEGNKTIGYVNILGGIGKNFQIQEGKIYEIYKPEGGEK